MSARGAISANSAVGQNSQGSCFSAALRHWLRSQRAHGGSDHCGDLGPGVAVMVLTPRALDCDDHLLGWIDGDQLAKGAIRRKSTVADAARRARRHPPMVTVSQRQTGPEPPEGAGRAIGLASEVAPT